MEFDARPPPQSIEAEQTVLGTILVYEAKAFDRVSDILAPKHFYLEPHAEIYRLIAQMIDKGEPVSPITIKRYADSLNKLDAIGGVDQLGALPEHATAPANLPSMADLIAEMYVLRHLVDMCRETIEAAHTEQIDTTAEQMVSRLDSGLSRLADEGAEGGGPQKVDSALSSALKAAQEAHASMGASVGVTTGFKDLDSMLGGLRPGSLYLVAGRPGMGKTALATCMAKAQASLGERPAYFSMEMMAEQLASRLQADEANLSTDDIACGRLTDEEFGRLVNASNSLSGLPFYIDDTPDMDMSLLRSRARRLVRKNGVNVLYVDYLQLLRAVFDQRKQYNRVEEVSALSRGLKQLAMMLEVPVIALSQLSRKVEERDNKRPFMSDLRDSGSLEQDADVVLFCFREEYYIPDDVKTDVKPIKHEGEKENDFKKRIADHFRWQRVRGTAEVICSKNRHGSTGTRRLSFQGAYTRFADLARGHDEDG